MSKRRKKNAPNLPEATLKRAREQAGLIEAEDNEDENPEDSSASNAVAEAKPKKSRRRARMERARLDPNLQKDNSPDSEMIAEQLENPTIVVTEEQMRQEYSYVLKDLRNMGLLAAVLFVALIGMAQFI